MVTNAVLTEVRQAGGRDAYGDVSDAAQAAAPVKWTGALAGYLTRVKRSVKVGDRRETIEVDMFIVRGRCTVSFAPGEQAKGDTVLIEDNRSGIAVSKRFRVVATDVRAVGSPADSTRLELTDERPA